MNSKYKPIFYIKIIKNLIIHVARDFNGNHVLKYGWIIFKKVNSQWAFEIIILSLSCKCNEKGEFKVCHSNAKTKIEK